MRRNKCRLISMKKEKLYLIFLLLSFTVFLFYGALYPFHDWRFPQANVLSIVLFGWLDHIFLFDIVQNLLLFLPFGLFASGYLLLHEKKIMKVLFLSTLTSFCVSFFIESLQTYNPARIPSLLDIALNTASGFLGALVALPLMPFYPKLIRFVKNSFLMGTKDNLWPLLGIAVWIAWGAYQVFPFIPTLHPMQLLETVKPIYLFVKREIPFYPMRFVHYALQAMMLYFSGKLFITPSRFMPLLCSFIALTFIAKIAAIGRLLSIEMILGLSVAIGLLALGQKFFGPVGINNEAINEPVRS